MIRKEEKLQQSYYTSTSSKYDTIHNYSKDSSHNIAFQFLLSMISYLNCKSVLDIGAGTGNLLLMLKNELQGIAISGIEPVEALIMEGYNKGLSKSELKLGNAYNLSHESNSVDIVCAFGVLHHVRHPDKVIAEMLRVSKKAIFISDANNFGQGSYIKRTIKQLINTLGLWKAFDFLATRGKGYHYSDGDGVFYSYSVYNNIKQINKNCRSIHFLNTSKSNISLYKTASHVSLLGIK